MRDILCICICFYLSPVCTQTKTNNTSLPARLQINVIFDAFTFIIHFYLQICCDEAIILHWYDAMTWHVVHSLCTEYLRTYTMIRLHVAFLRWPWFARNHFLLYKKFRFTPRNATCILHQYFEARVCDWMSK